MAQDVKPKWAVEGITVEDLHHVWADCWPYIKDAIDRFPQVKDKYTEEKILANLSLLKQQLWIGWSYEENRIVGAVVTEVFRDPKKTELQFCGIPLVGGDRWMEWGDSMWMLLKTWADAQGCTHMLGYGRKGWKRLYGFVDCGETEDGIPIFVRSIKGKR